MDINALPRFEPIEKMTYIDDGVQGLVYRLTDRWCVKICHGFGDLSELLLEAEINQELYGKGISVPEPRGMFKFSTSTIPDLPNSLNRKKFVPGFVREFVDGLLYGVIPVSLLGEAREKCSQELDKARGLGFMPSGDSHYAGNNVLYEVRGNSLERAVLIDFGFWWMRK